MPELSLDEAVQLLEDHGGYSWLLDAPPGFSFSVTSIVEHLAKTGVEPTTRTVQNWIKDLPHTTSQGGLGDYATRSDLIIMFAGRMRGRKLA